MFYFAYYYIFKEIQYIEKWHQKKSAIIASNIFVTQLILNVKKLCRKF